MKHIIFAFSILTSLSVISQESPLPAESISSVIDTVDVEAEFPGGVAAMNRWISENVNYPEEAIEMGEMGRVYVQFVVERDGTISNVNIVRGVSKSLDDEVRRLIKSMPIWIPGMAEGKAVRTRCTLPVNFTLSEPTKEEKKRGRKK
jgi:protein TonB